MGMIAVAVEEALASTIEQLQALYARAMALPGARGVERAVHAGLKAVDREMMQAVVSAKARAAVDADVREVRCLHCKGWAERYDEAAARWALSVRGRVDFVRPVYRCAERECQHERCLFDEELGLDPKEHFTPLVQDKVAWAGASGASFERASRDLAHQAELEVSAKQVHRVLEKTGRRALELQDAEVSRNGAPASAEAPIVPEERPETVVIEMDGTCVMGRDGTGHEIKCATVFGLDARAVTGSPGKERPLLLRRSYCATSHGIQSFGAMTWALASAWGVRSAQRIVVIGDGIEWIWKWSTDRLHRARPDGTLERPIEIVDFWHACENLIKARDAIYADPEGAPARKWYEQWRTSLRAGEIEAVVEELETRMRAAREGNRRDQLRLRASYFRGHMERMRYAAFEAAGLPIGSGAIEGTCKNLIKGRMDGVGMRWDAQEGIELMTALRVRLFNDRWTDLWPDNHTPTILAA